MACVSRKHLCALAATFLAMSLLTYMYTYIDSGAAQKLVSSEHGPAVVQGPNSTLRARVARYCDQLEFLQRDHGVLNNLIVDETHRLIWCNVQVGDDAAFSRMLKLALEVSHSPGKERRNVSDDIPLRFTRRLADYANWREMLRRYTTVLVVRNHWQRLVTSFAAFKRKRAIMNAGPGIKFDDFLRYAMKYYEMYKVYVKSSHLYPEFKYWAIYAYTCNPCIYNYDVIVSADTLLDEMENRRQTTQGKMLASSRDFDDTRYSKQRFDNDYGPLGDDVVEGVNANYYFDSQLFDFGLDYLYPYMKSP